MSFALGALGPKAKAWASQYRSQKPSLFFRRQFFGKSLVKFLVSHMFTLYWIGQQEKLCQAFKNTKVCPSWPGGKVA